MNACFLPMMCVNGYVSAVQWRMYIDILEKNNKIEVKFKLEDIYGRKSHNCEDTIVFGVRERLGYIPLEYKDTFILLREFVYLCTICGNDKKRVVCCMLSSHATHIINLDNFLRLLRRNNVKTDDRFKKTIDVARLGVIK
jgi:hypothetical protein